MSTLRKAIMTIATQPFFNELDMLEIKLNTMRDVVDLFVIGEATKTYTGIHKPLHFDEHKHEDRFKGFPIQHIIIDDLPLTVRNPWIREGEQRNRIAKEVLKHNADIVIWCDCDEIMRPDSVRQFADTKHPAMAMDFDWLRYYFNREHCDRWQLRTISRDRQQHVSVSPGMPMLMDAGWHFNFFGGREILLDKINATSHAVDPGSRGYWGEVRKGNHPELNRTSPYPIERLPQFIQDNRERFKDWFLPEGEPLT